MRRFSYLLTIIVASMALCTCTESGAENRAVLSCDISTIDNIPYTGVEDAKLDITVSFLSNLKAFCDGAVVSKAQISHEVVDGAYRFSVIYSVAHNEDYALRSGWIELTADDVAPLRITVNQLKREEPIRAYLGCLETPALSLLDEDPVVMRSAEYFGRQHEYATTNSDQVVVVHQFDDYGNSLGESNEEWYRNFTILYDNSMYAARWVAYSLSDWHFSLSSSIKRPDWVDNPSLTEYSGGYEQNSTYDRGHQIANMMRNKCSVNAQRQTFFHSNQMPQINSFNQGKWVTLEKRELVWKSECDTMYVVTGPIFDEGYITTPDKNGTAIPVATRYFKAMIKCNWSNGELSEVKGIGFLMDNVTDASSQAYTEAYTSIEEVEKACGFTLFANLPSAFLAAKKNSTPSAFTNSW